MGAINAYIGQTDVPLVLAVQDTSGAPVTTLTPTAKIQRISDGYVWDSASSNFVPSGETLPTMTHMGNGVYKYAWNSASSVSTGSFNVTYDTGSSDYPDAFDLVTFDYAVSTRLSTTTAAIYSKSRSQPIRSRNVEAGTTALTFYLFVTSETGAGGSSGTRVAFINRLSDWYVFDYTLGTFVASLLHTPPTMTDRGYGEYTQVVNVSSWDTGDYVVSYYTGAYPEQKEILHIYAPGTVTLGTDAITAASVSSAAVTKIQTGLMALTDTVDGVAVSMILELMMAMANGRFKKDFPTEGDYTFYKRDNETVLFVVNSSILGRTRL